MDEISPLIALPFKVGSLIKGESVFATCVDVAGVELIVNSRSLFLEPSMTKLPSTLDDRSVSSSSVPENGVLLKLDSAHDELNVGENGILVPSGQSESRLVYNNDVSQEFRGDGKRMAHTSESLASIVDSLYAQNGANGLCIKDHAQTNLEQILDNCKKSGVLHSMKNSSCPWGPIVSSKVAGDPDSVGEMGEAVKVREPKQTLSTLILEAPEDGKINKQICPFNSPPLWGLTSICGRRHEMEDSVVALPRFLKIPSEMLSENLHLSSINKEITAQLFGVYDGHGGCQVANYCRERLHLTLADEISTTCEHLRAGFDEHDLKARWLRVFLNCFHRLDNEVGGFALVDGDIASNPALPPIAPEFVGSTAVVAIVCSTHIIVANVGDSRAVLYRGKVPVPLSVDHKPNREDEYARIEAAGGKVIKWDGYRVLGVLAVSRSIGDRYLRPYVVADPEVMVIPRRKEDECLILASDGLWDVMTNDEACDLARRRILLWHKKHGATLSKERGEEVDPAAQDAADYLSQVAFQRGSRDNISVIVVDLKSQRKFKKKT